MAHGSRPRIPRALAYFLGNSLGSLRRVPYSVDRRPRVPDWVHQAGIAAFQLVPLAGAGIASPSRVMMWRFRTLPTLLLGLCACGRGPALPFDDAWSPARECETGGSGCITEVTLQRAVDILFVIDNSASMAEEQKALAENFSALVDVLERDGLGLDYRIGVIGSSREPMSATSCLERPRDFIWRGRDGYIIEAFDYACEDVCRVRDFEVVRTANGRDTEPRQRPWIQSSAEDTNIPSGVSMVEAFECMGPQGINGSGFESTLESMRDVIVDDVEGFIREEALFAVILVTDEEDCSMPDLHRQLLNEPNEVTRPLWTVPEGPTSAVCWNAGVRCEGGPGIYSSCVPENRDFNRQPTTPEDAVLYPVERYVEALRDLSNVKQRQGGIGTVLVAVIAGVPEGYPDGEPIVFQDSDLQDFNDEYGIGPSCGRGTEGIYSPPGIPPVRLREFAESFATDRRNLYSICSGDYSVALEDIATEIGRLGSRACVPGCVRDDDDSISGLQTSCQVAEELETGRRNVVAPCIVTSQGWSFPNDAETCYRTLTDRDAQTSFTHDDLSPQCVTRGANVEIVLERRPGAASQRDTVVRVDCPTVRPNAQGECD